MTAVIELLWLILLTLPVSVCVTVRCLSVPSIDSSSDVLLLCRRPGTRAQQWAGSVVWRSEEVSTSDTRTRIVSASECSTRKPSILLTLGRFSFRWYKVANCSVRPKRPKPRFRSIVPSHWQTQKKFSVRSVAVYYSALSYDVIHDVFSFIYICLLKRKLEEVIWFDTSVSAKDKKDNASHCCW